MTAGVLLGRLEGVHRSGNGWRADCPNGHAKARGSLSIAQADDGRVLLHCFACADVYGILSTVGLELADLFPARIRNPSPEARQRAQDGFKRSSWAAALRVLSREATIVGCAAGMLRQNHALAAEDESRLTVAMQRIDDARVLLT